MKKKSTKFFNNIKNQQLKFDFFEIDDKKKSARFFAHAKKSAVENYGLFEADDNQKNRRNPPLMRKNQQLKISTEANGKKRSGKKKSTKSFARAKKVGGKKGDDKKGSRRGLSPMRGGQLLKISADRGR